MGLCTYLSTSKLRAHFIPNTHLDREWTINCCGIDKIEEDATYRLNQTISLSKVVLKESLGKIQVSINNSDIDKEDILITVFNPSPFARTEIVIAYIDIPKELEMKNFVMYDEDHNKIDYAMLVTKNSGKIFRDKTVIALHYDSPSIISIAICQGSRRPKIDYPPFEFYHFSKNQLKAGIVR